MRPWPHGWRRSCSKKASTWSAFRTLSCRKARLESGLRSRRRIRKQTSSGRSGHSSKPAKRSEISRKVRPRADMGRSGSNSTERGLKVRPPEAANAGLVYASDDEPGIHRVRKGKGFTYFGPDGKRVTDRATLERIRGLVIPPAWKEVWISTRPRGHLQATGRDARGRKQPIYHPTWRAVRDADKFSRMVGFARALPRIRRRVARDLGQPGLPREKVVATIVRLLEMTFARIGNEEYARDNGSFGLTTLRDRHATISGSNVRFLFRGKSGRELELGVTNRRVARVVKRCEELPGQMLLRYRSHEGDRLT